MNSVVRESSSDVSYTPEIGTSYIPSPEVFASFATHLSAFCCLSGTELSHLRTLALAVSSTFLWLPPTSLAL